jgi:O-acetyl-ADP-ribose deacetylase (regulator of RNase III)
MQGERPDFFGKIWYLGRFVRIEALQADITTLAVDAVVNAANSGLTGGGGVDGAIHRAAGSAQLRACTAILGGCQPGDAKVTPGFALPARWIIHTVGPIWSGGGRGEAETLASCYRRSLERCLEVGARTIAFPAISTGIYRFPPPLAAEIAVSTLREPNAQYRDLSALLVAFDAATLQLYRALLSPPGSA